MLLANKIRRIVAKKVHEDHRFRIWVDRIASRYGKADETVGVVSNNIINQRFPGRSPVRSVITKDSAQTPMIQLCDLLLGAVIEGWQQKASNTSKLAIRRAIADHLGWDDLRWDTFNGERKFNVWYFYDPTQGARLVDTREVKLRYPYKDPRLG